MNRNIHDQLDAYLDGLLDQDALVQVEGQLESNPELAKEVDLQAKIDDSLNRLFVPPPSSTLDLSFLKTENADSPAEQHIEQSADVLPFPAAAEQTQASRYKPALLVLAASMAWIVVAWQVFWAGNVNQPQLAFRERPLTEIYEECVSEGFKPYWVCDNDQIFAATFEKRQGVPLNLVDLPEDRRMVGLSYLSGLSRKSTSLLAAVGEIPVIVFVDRADRDWNPETGFFADKGLTVTKVEKFGLTLYEVSPLRYTSIVDFLRPPTESPTEK